MTQEIKDSRLIAFAILGYIFCFFGWQLPLILVVAYALAIAKDNLLSKQSLQALYLYIAYTVLISVIGWVFAVFVWLATAARIYGLVSFLTAAEVTISTLIGVLLFVLVLLMILKLTRKTAPELPLLGRLADLTLGLAAPRAKPAYTAPAASAAPPAQATAAAPPPPPLQNPSAQAPPSAQSTAAPQQRYSPPPVPADQPQAEEQPDDPVESISEPSPSPEPFSPPEKSTWTCSCGRENKGKFCVSCGKPKA